VLSIFDLIAVLLVLTATFGWFNHVVIRLPHTIGLLVMGLAASLFLIFRLQGVPEEGAH
jgi:CPA1 family monovalent cation:H+ antiporter